MNDISNSGGVAARRGFKFQDHVAALYVLLMLEDRRIEQVECETSDDITLRWLIDGVRFFEYVQVKSNDVDRWNWGLLTKREIATSPTSIVEKSLLCEKGPDIGRFRIVTRNGVRADLAPLTVPLEKRDPRDLDDIVARLKKKYPTVSGRGSDLEYWARNAFWEPLSSEEDLRNKNLWHVSRLCDGDGCSARTDQIRELYRDVLELVEAAASADRRVPTDKTLTRQQMREWWRERLRTIVGARPGSPLPYRVPTPNFLVKLHEFTDPIKPRATTGYDAEYERKQWRSTQLANYLVKWIPELVLKASEIAQTNHLTLADKTSQGLRKLRELRHHGIERLLSETLLHAILRNFFDSEPIACKLFYRTGAASGVVNNAHIVQHHEGDQIWLGRTHVFRGFDVDALIASACAELENALATPLLQAEREIILELRQPEYLRKDDVEEALADGAPIDRFLRVLRFAILVIYDSKVLGGGHCDDYRARLVAELTQFANSYHSQLPASVDEIQIHLFLIPVESLDRLKRDFEVAADLA